MIYTVDTREKIHGAENNTWKRNTLYLNKKEFKKFIQSVTISVENEQYCFSFNSLERKTFCYVTHIFENEKSIYEYRFLTSTNFEDYINNMLENRAISIAA